MRGVWSPKSRVVLPCSPTGTPLGREKSLKVISLRGSGNPEIENLHPSAVKTLLLLKMCVFCCRGSPTGGHGTLPRGDPKNHGNSICFSNAFRMGFWGTLERQSADTDEPRNRKRVPKGYFGESLGSTLMPKLQYWHLTKTCKFTAYLA